MMVSGWKLELDAVGDEPHPESLKPSMYGLKSGTELAAGYAHEAIERR